MTTHPAAAFTSCIRPDCTELPRYCSAACAYELEESGPTLRQACELLKRAGDSITAYESEAPPSWDDDAQDGGGILADIGAFLAKKAGT